MSEVQEVWKWVVGFEGRYSISNLGKVGSFVFYGRKLDIPVVLKTTPGSAGYQRCTLIDEQGNKHSDLLVHRLVAEAFIGPCPKGMEVLHKDETRSNPRLDNLEYGTHAKNIKTAIASGRLVPPLPSYWKKEFATMKLRIKELEEQVSCPT